MIRDPASICKSGILQTPKNIHAFGDSTVCMESGANKGPGITAASIALTVIAVVIFALRAYSQRLVTKLFHLDEVFLFIGLILTISLCIETCLCFHWGAGRHVENILATDPHPLISLRNFWIVGYVSVVNWTVAMFAIKLSLLWLYKRIFLVSNMMRRWFRILIHVVMFYVICTSVAIVFSYVFICTPISHWWAQANEVVGAPVPQGDCPNLIARGIACAALNVLSDFLILSLGISGLWTLRLNKRRKFMAGCILALGSTCCIVGIARLPILLQATFGNDPTWSNANSLLIGLLEAAIGIISASLPGLAPLVRRWNQKVGSREESSDGKPGSDIHGMHGSYIPMDDVISYTPRSEHHDTLSPTRKESDII